MFIDEEIEFIKSQIAHHRRSVEFFFSKKDAAKANRHTGILRRFEEILPKMEKIAEHGVPVAPPPAAIDTDKIGSRFGNISDLPPELRDQLVSIQHDEFEQKILDVIADEYGGIATIDEIMVGLYRTYEEIHKRDALATKIYRMTRKELLFSVKGRKGVYSLTNDNPETEPSDENTNGDIE